MHNSAMNRTLYHILTKWLKEANYSIDFNQFEIALLSHPDYGGLTSITDTLSEFAIENTAAQLPFEALSGLTEPFVAFIQQDHQQQFALFYPQNDGLTKLYLDESKIDLVTNQALQKLWTGNIVVIEENTIPKKRRLQITQFALSCVLVGITALFLYTNPNSIAFGYFICGLFGVFISGLIVQHQLGFANGLSSKFCSLNKNTSCDSVLNSKAANLTKNIGLSDVGIVYFTTQIFVLLLFGSVIESTISLLYLISIVATPFVAYSLYLQKFIIKKWCPLCLGVVAMLLIQGAIACIAIEWASVAAVSIYAFLLIPAVVIIVSAAWYLLQPILRASLAVKGLTIESLSFRRNFHLLLPFLRSQPTIPTDFNFETIEIGNCYANNQLVIITNPLCESCIKLHGILEKSIAIHNNLSLQLIFYVPLNNKDPRTIIAGHLLAQNSKTENLLVTEWYSNPNPATFTKKYGKGLKNDTATTLQKQKDWCHHNSIYVTPTIIINGKRFPNYYHPSDIEYLLAEMLQASTNSQNVEATNMVFVDKT